MSNASPSSFISVFEPVTDLSLQISVSVDLSTPQVVELLSTLRAPNDSKSKELAENAFAQLIWQRGTRQFVLDWAEQIEKLWKVEVLEDESVMLWGPEGQRVHVDKEPARFWLNVKYAKVGVTYLTKSDQSS